MLSMESVLAITTGDSIDSADTTGIYSHRIADSIDNSGCNRSYRRYFREYPKKSVTASVAPTVLDNIRCYLCCRQPTVLASNAVNAIA